jgi:hypothetical protein
VTMIASRDNDVFGSQSPDLMFASASKVERMSPNRLHKRANKHSLRQILIHFRAHDRRYLA